jgi:hypothetical protein
MGKGKGKGKMGAEWTPSMTILSNTDECFMVALTPWVAKRLVHFLEARCAKHLVLTRKGLHATRTICVGVHLHAGRTSGAAMIGPVGAVPLGTVGMTVVPFGEVGAIPLGAVPLRRLPPLPSPPPPRPPQCAIPTCIFKPAKCGR